MARELISKKTRYEFQEWLVDWTLRTISNLFDSHNIKYVAIPEENLPSGQRRSLVQCYYASVNWSDPKDVRRVLDAYEDILIELLPESEGKQRLVRHLEKDGYLYENGKYYHRL